MAPGLMPGRYDAAHLSSVLHEGASCQRTLLVIVAVKRSFMDRTRLDPSNCGPDGLSTSKPDSARILC